MIFTIDPDTAKDFDDSCHVDMVLDDETVLSFKELTDAAEDQ